MCSRFEGDPLNSDRGIMYMLHEYVEEQANPRARDMARKLQVGLRLSEDDLAHVDQVLAQMRKLLPLLDHHPEEQRLVAAVIARHERIRRLSPAAASLVGRWMLRATTAAKRLLRLRWAP